MKSNPPGALATLLKTDPDLCQQLQEAIQSFPLQPKEKAPKKAAGCQSELDPVLSEQLQVAMESLGLPLTPQEKRPASDRRIDQVTIDARAASPAAEPTAAEWTAKDVESCVARVLKKLERPRKAAERLIGELLPELSLPQPWVTFRNSKGKLFFLNPVSRSTTWCHPLEPALQEMAVLCKSLLELDDAWRSQLLSGQRETIDQEEQQQLSSWQLTSPGLWQHVSGDTTSMDPSHVISASSRLKRLALSKLQNPRYLSELLLMEPPALPAPKKEHTDPTYISKAIQWFINSIDDDSSCTPTPPATGRSQVGVPVASEAAPSQAAPSRSTLQGPPTSTEKSQSPEVEDSSGDPKVDVVADPHRAMASDGLMTFCLERKADAKTVPEGLVAEAVDGRGNAVESVETVKEAEPVEDAKAPVVQEAEDLPSIATVEDAAPAGEQKPRKASEDLRSEGSAEVAHLVQQLAPVMDTPGQGHTGQSQSQSGGAEISAGETGEASASSGLADLLQQVSEILAGQMQQGASDKKASNSVREAGGAPHRAKKEIQSLEEAADPGVAGAIGTSASGSARAMSGEAATSRAMSGQATKGQAPSKVEELQGNSPGSEMPEVSQPQPGPTAANNESKLQLQVTRSLGDFDPTDPNKEERVVDYVIQHLRLLDAEKTGRISPGKLCMFFELLGMDVYDLTQAIAASKHRQDGTVDYAAFVRWLMTSET